VAVIGAGPHGLSAVAHLRDAGVPTVAFGDPLGFWRETMPSGMLLRSSPRASSIDDPGRRLSLARWAQAAGREIAKEVPIGDFIDYGLWFKDQVVADLDPRLIANVRAHAGRFLLTLEDGEELPASRVIVAAGLAPFAYTPELFAALPAALASHVAARPRIEDFAGRSVAVIGAGQSALETAALLHEAGAEVELIGRTDAIFWLGSWIAAPANGNGASAGAGDADTTGAGDADTAGAGDGNGGAPVLPGVKAPAKQTWRARTGLHWRPAPTDVGGRFSSWIGAAPDVIRYLPRGVRAPLTYHCIRPAGAYWLPDRLREVKITLSRRVVSASERDGCVQLCLDDGSQRTVDHVLLGTGYHIDVSRYPFLAPELTARLRMVDGSPVLGRGLQSSVPGLHFVGAPAAESFGPVMRFVIGTAYTGPAVTQGILGRALPVFRWAF
jgi:hypothetical protein